MNPLDIMEIKYLLMESSQSELGSILAHDSINLAMIFIGQVNGRIRKVWAVSTN